MTVGNFVKLDKQVLSSEGRFLNRNLRYLLLRGCKSNYVVEPNISEISIRNELLRLVSC